MLTSSRAALLLVLVVLCAWYLDPGQGFLAGGRAHGDGVYYYAHLRSLVLDHDVDFTNDYALLGNPHRQGPGPRGLPTNRFTVGPAILWLPGFLVGHVVTALGVAIGWISGPLDGTSPVHQRVTLFMSVVWGFAAIVLVERLARACDLGRAGGLAAIAVVFATPLGWYMVRQPSYAHACSAFAVAAFVVYWHQSSERGAALRRWAILGGLAGLMALVRPQNAGFVVLVAAEWIGWGVDAARRRGGVRDRLLAIAVFASVAVVTFSPQMLIWNAIYGRALVIPQGPAFMLWHHSLWVEALYSSRNGLFAWSPLTYLGVIGLGVHIIRTRATTRRLCALLLLAFAIQTYVNGSAEDWWAGWAFGGRRFTNCSIAVGLGLAAIFAGLEWRRLGRAALLVPTLAALSGIHCSVSLMDDYRVGRVERARPQSMLEPDSRAFGPIGAWLHGWLGHIGSIPANWVFAARARVPPARYDLSAGWALVLSRGDYRGWDRIRFDEPRWALGGFSGPVWYEGQRCGWVSGERATFSLPLRRPMMLEGRLRLAGAVGTTVEVRVGDTVALATEVGPGWNDYPFRIGADDLRAGINYVEVRQELGADTAGVGWAWLELWLPSHLQR